MFLPGGFLSGAILPWILLAPALPLVAALVRRPSMSMPSVLLLVSCLLALLTGIFGYLASDAEPKPAVLHFMIFIDAATAFLLLWVHSGWYRLKQVLLAAGLLFCGIFLALIGGFLVGFGARYGDGCTSGHAITGLSHLQFSSLITVIGFFIGGLLMTWVILPLIFG